MQKECVKARKSFNAGQYKKAIRILKKTCQDYPKFYEGYLALALTYQKLENFQLARKAFVKAYDISSESPRSFVAQEEFFTAR